MGGQACFLAVFQHLLPKDQGDDGWGGQGQASRMTPCSTRRHVPSASSLAELARVSRKQQWAAHRGEPCRRRGVRQRGEADQLAKEESPRSLAATILHALRRISVFRSPRDLPGSVYNKMDAGSSSPFYARILRFTFSYISANTWPFGRPAARLGRPSPAGPLSVTSTSISELGRVYLRFHSVHALPPEAL